MVAPLTAVELLRRIYVRERPILQTNNWAALRIRVEDLISELCPPRGPHAPSHIIDLLRALRLDGKLMFLPDWDRWGHEEDGDDGSMVPSRAQWEPTAGFPDPPSWVRRNVFLPDDLKYWSVRSRVAETSRLLYANRERFGLEAATAHLGYELQARFRPDRNTSPIASVVHRLHAMVDAGQFALAPDRSALKLAIEIVAAGLGHPSIAGFQDRAWGAILSTLFDAPRPHEATMITAGVSSGKTFAFLLPALTLAVYRALTGTGRRNRVLIIYPRTSLVEDQYHSLRRLIEQVNVEFAARRPGQSLSELPALDAGQMLAQSLGVTATSLADVLPQVAAMGVEFILTTPESLKNRMLDPRAVRTYLENVELVVFDEIHLMEGVDGCHGIHFVRRLRHLLKDLHSNPNFEPAWVGASATVAEPVEHCARVLTLQPSRVRHIAPAPNELVQFGSFHHVFLHTRVGKASISAITNGLSSLAHTRNDCTPYNHYVDPASTPRQRLPSDTINKTIAFVDSLSTIGRLRFTTADNERTYEPHEQAPPYYSWFYRPAARLRATQQEETSIGAPRLAQIRNWCQKCYHGEPARIDAAALQVPELTFLRTGLRMGDDAIARSSPPGFRQALQSLSGQVGNLDKCPFHQHQLCWWFSQDSGERLTLGANRIAIDQLRIRAYTSKTDDVDEGLHENVNDYFVTESTRLWERHQGGIPNTEEDVSVLLASPRIEVGVDFRNVRDGITHKAMRSAASFQQKVGRVGREDNSDSLIVTFLAHRPTDAHFAHQPSRLIDAAHLDPIPLKSENPDVVRNHMFAAGLEFIASRPVGLIPDYGRELNIIGTGSNRVSESWEDKVNACLAYLASNRPAIRNYLLSATGHSANIASTADEAIDRLQHILGLFVVNLAGAYSVGLTAAHWFKQNQRPAPDVAFQQAIARIEELAETLDLLALEAPSLAAPLNGLLATFQAASPSGAQITGAATALQTALMPAISTLDPSLVGRLFGVVGTANSVATTLGSLTLSAPLADLREAYAIVQAFFEEQDPGTRIRSQYYLHDVLTKLLPFRRYYPHGLIRTHFQHVNARQVRILVGGSGTDDEDYESLSTALYELLPGTWNYRWLHPKKSPCGRIDQMAGTAESFCNLSLLERPNGAAFEPTGAFLTPGELPVDMPTTSGNVPILRPTRLRMERSFNQPSARFDNQLIGDEDEAPRENDPKRTRNCPTLPRAFPAMWYRVQQHGTPSAVAGVAAPGHATHSLPHTFPAIGRALFDQVTFSAELETDRYVYAIDRSYGSGGIESPRIHYRRGGPTPTPVVLGDTLGNTDGLAFQVKQATADTVLAWVLLSASHLNGEMTIRALLTWIARSTGAGPFQAEMLRRVILMEHLDQGGTLISLNANTIQTCLSAITRPRYDQIVTALLDGVFAGVDPAEAVNGRARQVTWYDDAWPAFLRLQLAATSFTDVVVRDATREILIHTLAVTTLDALGRLVGASDGDLGYFHRHDHLQYFVFDSVQGGNGCSETIAKFMHIPPLRRLIASRAGGSAALPSADGFMLLEETLAPCPAQSATQLLMSACQLGVADPSHLRFPRGLVADLQARTRHEYDAISGSQGIVAHLLAAFPSLFGHWRDLLWLQVVPERFSAGLRAAGACANFESLKARTHLCVTGCLECVDNGDQSIYGALRSREHVSKNLLDAVRAQVIASEPQAFLQIAANMAVGPALQANAGRPVLDASGAAVTAQIEEDGKPRQVLLTQVLSTVAPDLSVPGAPLLTPSTTSPGTWDVHIPFLAGYRDERPTT